MYLLSKNKGRKILKMWSFEMAFWQFPLICTSNFVIYWFNNLHVLIWWLISLIIHKYNKITSHRNKPAVCGVLFRLSINMLSKYYTWIRVRMVAQLFRGLGCSSDFKSQPGLNSVDKRCVFFTLCYFLY